MASLTQTRSGGGVLLHRLGPLTAGEQSRWTRAPKSRGLWAFPWPAFEMFFAYHQYLYAAPARLRTSDSGPTHRSAYVDHDGNPPPATIPLVELQQGSDWLVRTGFHQEQEEWVRTTGRRVVRRHQFWYSGDLYTHLTEKGDILRLDQWRRMSAATYAEAVRRSGGTRALDVYQGTLRRLKCTADHLEVFIPAGAGRLEGRPSSRR